MPAGIVWNTSPVASTMPSGVAAIQRRTRCSRLWREKRGEIEPEDLSRNLIVQFGNVAEPLNRRWCERNTGPVHTAVQRRVAPRWISTARRSTSCRCRAVSSSPGFPWTARDGCQRPVGARLSNIRSRRCSGIGTRACANADQTHCAARSRARGLRIRSPQAALKFTPGSAL